MGHPAGGAMQGYGKVRNPIVCILLCIITFGIYGLVHMYMVHEENKRYMNVGPGGVLPLIMTILGMFVLVTYIYTFIRIFMLPADIGQMQAATGNPNPMSGMTGLWIFVPLIGVFIWFFIVQNGMNDVWRAKGAPG